MIGATRHVHPTTGMVEYTKSSAHSQASKQTYDHSKSDGQLIYRLDPVRERGKLIFQIGTSDPDRAVAAARLIASDVAGIDVNAGCPKPFSTSGGMGAALLKTPDKLCGILRALVGAIVPEFQIGVSVKIRLLETPEETEALVRALCTTGITGLTIHCRTAAMRKHMPVKREQLRMIVDICHENGVACLINGDVADRDEGMRLAAEYGADGAMIATAAERNPSCFRTSEQGGLAPWREAVGQYIAFTLEANNRFGNAKFLLNSMIPGKESVHRKMHSSGSYAELCEVLGFPLLIERARLVDDWQGLSPEAKAKVKAAKEQAVREKQKQKQAQQKVNKRKYDNTFTADEKVSGTRSRSRSPRSPPRKTFERAVNGNSNVAPGPAIPTCAAPATFN